MKQLTLAFLFASLLFVGGIGTSHAGAIIGATEPTQIANNLELIPINLSDAATSINTTLMQVKQTVLDPLANNLITISQLQTANGIINLVNGNNLIAENPQNVIDKRGLEIVKASLSVVGNQKGPYSESLMNAIQSNFISSSLTSKLAEINKSTIPSTVQNKVCDDAMLSNLARQDVQAADGSVDQTAFTQRKAELYQALCSVNASLDPTVAAKLNQVNEQRPGIGGWDTWLAITTGGENEYHKTVEGALVIADAKQQAEAQKAKELDWGGGVASQTVCAPGMRILNDDEGNPYPNPEQAPCLSTAVQNPAGLLRDSLSQAANAGLTRLSNIQGAGSILQMLGSIQNLTAGINSARVAFNTTTSRIDSTFGGGGSGSGAAPANTSSSVTVAAAPSNDLAGDTSAKDKMTGPIYKLFDNDMKVLQDLQDTDQNILSDLAVYEAKLNDTKACYQDVSPTDPAAVALFQNRDSIISGLKAKVSDDTTKVATARDTITTARTKIDASQSTNEIMDIFNAYQDAAGNLPDYRTLAERKADYSQNKSRSTADMGSNGELTKLYDRCVSMRTSFQNGF